MLLLMKSCLRGCYKPRYFNKQEKFQPFLNFKAQSELYETEMKQKQNRNALKGGKCKKGNLTETVKVKKVT